MNIVNIDGSSVVNIVNPSNDNIIVVINIDPNIVTNNYGSNIVTINNGNTIVTKSSNINVTVISDPVTNRCMHHLTGGRCHLQVGAPMHKDLMTPHTLAVSLHLENRPRGVNFCVLMGQ